MHTGVTNEAFLIVGGQRGSYLCLQILHPVVDHFWLSNINPQKQHICLCQASRKGQHRIAIGKRHITYFYFGTIEQRNRLRIVVA